MYIYVYIYIYINMISEIIIKTNSFILPIRYCKLPRRQPGMLHDVIGDVMQ